MFQFKGAKIDAEEAKKLAELKRLILQVKKQMIAKHNWTEADKNAQKNFTNSKYNGLELGEDSIEEFLEKGINDVRTMFHGKMNNSDVFKYKCNFKYRFYY